MKVILLLSTIFVVTTVCHGRSYNINEVTDKRQKRETGQLDAGGHDAVDPDPEWYGHQMDDNESLYLAAKRKNIKKKRKNKKKKKAATNERSTFMVTSSDSIVDAESQKDEIIAALGRQMILQQFFVEEKIRSDGGSGLKGIRQNYGGTQSYHYPDDTSTSVAAIHEHANNIRTIGMGEFIGVLNGVEFRTRHNDYRLKQPHSTGSGYHQTEDIEFPEVPPEVLELETVEEQIDEMREFFKAFKDQNITHRDYRPYFPAVLCYLEGAWTLADGDNIDEPFDSDRHFIDATSWFDLQEKVRFTSVTGRKSQLENFAYLPTTIVEMVNDTVPRFAQWNYRILCHKVSKDVPTIKLRPVEHLAARFSNQWTYDKYLQTRATRFQIHDHAHHIENKERDTFLDTLMHEIPGKDNYQGNITDDAMGATVLHINGQSNEEANAAFYHRYFKVIDDGAMGEKIRKRGFSDPQLFVALTTQEKVAAFSYEQCTGKRTNKVCEKLYQRVSYAIPLEIIYLSPLSLWNPYNITYKGDYNSEEGKTVNALNEDGLRRSGQRNLERAFNGTNSKLYYRTPSEFFASTKEGQTEPADTTRNSVGVLDENGELRVVRASGTRIFFPEIENVGKIRQRYPIMPIHAEGNAIWKELNALRQAVMNMEENLALYRVPPPFDNVDVQPIATTYTFYTSVSHKPDLVDNHHHTFTMSLEDFNQLKYGNGRKIFTTSMDNSHTHDLEVKYSNKNGYFKFVTCGSQNNCWDGHDKQLTYDENF